MDKCQLSDRISAASKRIPADVVVKNGNIIDVFNQQIIDGDLAIFDGVFVGIGEFEGKEIIDAKKQYVVPGFIDGHVHIESAMVTPEEFSKIVVPHGVTSIVADPHEIANVSGTDGIQFMIDNSENLSLDVFFALPSCVPATPFENAGALLNAEHLRPFYEHERVIGLGEVMDFPAVRNTNESMIDKLLYPSNHNKTIDGHAAGLDADGINVYMTAGIRSDHEAINPEEARKRLERGMYLMIREGSVTKDLNALIEVVNEKNARRCVFVTDDKYVNDLINEGSIDHNIRLAIQRGVDPILAIQMATLNTAECFGLKQKGAIAPGYDADFLLLNDLQEIDIHQVYKSGKLVAEKGSYLIEDIESVKPPDSLINSVQFGEIHAKQLQIPLKGNRAHIIQLTIDSVVTKHVIQEVDVSNHYFQPSVSKDQLKLAVIERHHNTGNIGLGIVNGLNFQSGAIASTVAHDSHNLVVAGTNDEDMLKAIETVRDMQGGIVIVNNEEVLASLPLSISGLIADADFSFVNERLKHLNHALTNIGFEANFNPFMALSFLALPVIPEIKLTNLGLFDVGAFEHIDIGI